MTPPILDEKLLAQLNALDAPALLRWSAEQFGPRAAIVTSFQYSGCVLIDLAHRAGLPLRVATVDTLRLHEQTYALMDQLEQRYQIAIERFRPDPAQVARMVAQHGEFLFFDSKAKQEYCCRIRKTDPNKRCLETLDVWIIGVRRDQSKWREQTPKASLIDLSVDGGKTTRKLLKLAPMVDTTEAELAAYVSAHEVPCSALYDQGYKSIGCVICSTPVLAHEESRAGRWRWFNQDAEDNKECGIHSHGSGI